MTYAANLARVSPFVTVDTSGNVGVGTSTITTGTRFEVKGGNVKIATSGNGLLFPDGSFQTTAGTATTAVGGTGAVQYANGTTFAGDNANFYYDSATYRLGIGTSSTSIATLNVKGSDPALFSTASGSDYQVVVGNSISYGSTVGWSPSTGTGYVQLVGGTQMIVWKNGAVGINGITPVNTLDVGGGAVIGGGLAYAGAASAPSNGLLVQGSVGIGTTSVSASYKLEVSGGFAATTKSFVIDHPSKSGMKLRYGSLEGPENGVYIRGRTTSTKIELPDYWTELVDAESITVSLTPIGKKQEIYVKEIKDNKIILGGTRSIDCYFVVFGERKDVDKLIVEY